MSEKTSGTNGGGRGTSGARRRRLLWLILGALTFSSVQALANIESTIADFAGVGRDTPRWQVWTWELTSITIWYSMLPLIWWIVKHARPPRLSAPVAVLAHVAATIPISAAHVLGMIALRKLVYAAMADSYDFGSLPGMLLYEYRKDAATYILIGAFVAFAQWLLSRPEPAGDADVLLVADGNVTHRVPVDAVDWAASAGNYVEIAWGERVLLHRSTLAALAARLGPGFAQIHRGRIVRRAAVERIETDRNGDFTVTLRGGTELRGSRRYRGALHTSSNG